MSESEFSHVRPLTVTLIKYYRNIISQIQILIVDIFITEGTYKLKFRE